jgi:PAS domain S-box-containing protein
MESAPFIGRHSSPDFQRLFESSPGLYLVLTPEFTIVAVSDTYLRATMTQREEVLGRSIFDVFPDNPHDAQATGVANLRASLERAVQQQTADAMAVQRYDIRRPASQGGEFTERYWSPINCPVVGPDQKTAYIIHQVEDVTEFVRLKQLGAEQAQLTQKLLSRGEQMEAEIIRRAQEIQVGNQRLRQTNEELIRLHGELEQRVQKRTEELAQANDSLNAEVLERRRHEALLQSILNNTFDAIISIDERGMIETFNEAGERIFGYSRAEVVGRNVSMLMPQPYCSQHDGYLETYLRTGIAKIMGVGREVVGRRKDGAEFPIDLTVTECKQQAGEQRRFIGVVRDITERVRLQEQLHQAQKMEAFGQLSGGVAHDFNNLLTVIVGYCECLEDDPAMTYDSRAMLHEIHRASDRAASLTRQLLAFSRKQVFQSKVLILNEIVAETSSMLRRLIGEDITLETALSPTLWPVRVDAGQIEQVLMNLVVNARDAMPQGGRLTIETANVELDESYSEEYLDVQPGRYVVLAVSDTGCGMDPITKARIFEPFFTTKAPGKGTGLGLATVFGIVKQSGGHVTVYSEPAKGTAFRIYLPKVESVVELPSEEKFPKPSRDGVETILVVEDAPMVRNLACRILRSHGYTVLEADGGVEALRICEQHAGTIHLVLTDVVMPEMSGRELSELFRARKLNLKVLFMSGYTDDAVMRHGILEAEASFIQKPFTPSSLAQKVREVLDS